jgi:hypothetical protein
MRRNLKDENERLMMMVMGPVKTKEEVGNMGEGEWRKRKQEQREELMENLREEQKVVEIVMNLQVQSLVVQPHESWPRQLPLKNPFPGS